MCIAAESKNSQQQRGRLIVSPMRRPLLRGGIYKNSELLLRHNATTAATSLLVIFFAFLTPNDLIHVFILEGFEIVFKIFKAFF